MLQATRLAAPHAEGQCCCIKGPARRRAWHSRICSSNVGATSTPGTFHRSPISLSTQQHLMEVLRKARLDTQLLEFFPQQVRAAQGRLGGCWWLIAC